MIRNEVIIGVSDVEKSSLWYQNLLGCKSNHGGTVFEILVDEDGTVVLCLHKWGDHDHPTLRDAKVSSGNGLILYFRVDDLDKVWKNAQKLNATIEKPIRRNENSAKDEFALRDVDGYYLLISL